MTVRIGEYEFDQVSYDARGDVLYLGVGGSGSAASTYATPEGHAIRFDDNGDVMGITIVNAKWLMDREGKITITIPRLIETPAEDLAAALAAS
jgi:uncharacterized protein YuzE